ncbi:hypothetical protein CFP59_08780 [Streptomyces malaysiensis subsp. malaysiensis]|nr:hypothetical protein CFP59_08780 [Streptomyces sp. M56]
MAQFALALSADGEGVETGDLLLGEGQLRRAAVLLQAREVQCAGGRHDVFGMWDVIATLLERRMAGNGTPNRVSTVNMALGLATTAGMIIAAFSTIGKALLVFGVWALLSGAIQLAVAIRRRRTVGGQWPMVISGGQSVLAGATVAATSASATSSLSTVAGYSAFGAFWFLVSVIALSIRSRREKG